MVPVKLKALDEKESGDAGNPMELIPAKARDSALKLRCKVGDPERPEFDPVGWELGPLRPDFAREAIASFKLLSCVIPPPFRYEKFPSVL